MIKKPNKKIKKTTVVESATILTRYRENVVYVDKNGLYAMTKKEFIKRAKKIF